MDEEGAVSLWLGTASSQAAFDAALKETFSDDGDSLGSPFSRAFEIEHLDESFREAEYFGEPRSTVDELLLGASYDHVIIPRFRAIAATRPANAVVLLYNHRHEGPASWTNGDVALTFVGSVSYR